MLNSTPDILHGYFREGLLVKKLEPMHEKALMSLQDAVFSAMQKKEDFVLTSAGECRESLEKDCCIGVWDGDCLVAVSIMVVNRPGDRNIGQKLGLSPADCVTYDTTFIRSDYRGRGLQRHFIQVKNIEARLLGATTAFATVSPTNKASLDNLIASGFRQVDRTSMYGGFDRCVMRMDIPAEEAAK